MVPSRFWRVNLLIRDLNKWRFGGEEKHQRAADSIILKPCKWMNDKIELFGTFRAGQPMGAYVANSLFVYRILPKVELKKREQKLWKYRENSERSSTTQPRGKGERLELKTESPKSCTALF